MKELYGIQVTADNKEVAEKADILVLSVKPQFYAETIQEIRESVREDQMVITIAPGKTLAPGFHTVLSHDFFPFP